MKLTRSNLSLRGLGLVLALLGSGIVALLLQAYPTLFGKAAVPAAQQVRGQQGPADDLAALRAEIDHLKDNKVGINELTSELKDELTALRSQLAQVNRDQTLISREIDHTADQISESGLKESAAPAGNRGAEGVPLTPEQERAREEAQAWAQVELLEGTLLGEQPDPAWAGTATQALYKTFQADEKTGIHPVDADCRATLCRLQLFLNGSTTPEDNFRKLVHLTPWQGQGFVRLDGESGEAVVYLAREEHSLPQASE